VDATKPRRRPARRQGVLPDGGVHPSVGSLRREQVREDEQREGQTDQQNAETNPPVRDGIALRGEGRARRARRCRVRPVRATRAPARGSTPSRRRRSRAGGERRSARELP
jgi:hypothetical protein